MKFFENDNKIMIRISIVSFILSFMFFVIFVAHDYFTGAMLPTWHDPSPEIQARIAIHAPISMGLFILSLLFATLGIILAMVTLVKKYVKNTDDGNR